MYEKIREVEGFLLTNYRMKVDHVVIPKKCIVQFLYEDCILTIPSNEVIATPSIQLSERIANDFEILMKGEALND